MKKELIGLASLLILAALVFGGWYVYTTYLTTPPPPIDYVLEPVRDGSFSGTVPPLDHTPVLASNVPEEARTILLAQIAETQEKLEEYPYDGNLWMNLALRYHTANDFKAAEEVWLFITSIPPANVTALNNLGRMYHFELKSYEKAEEYFMKALEVNPDRTDTYFELFDLYRYSYKKDTTAAVDTLKQGMERFPDDVNFPAALGTYYRDSGRPNQARAQFERALSIARTIGDMNLVQKFTQELSAL